jgi:hypothetical protein
MNPNYNFTGEEFTEENWRELPDELPPFTTESAIATGADFEFDLTYRSIRGELNENYCSYGDQIADRNPLSETLLDQKSRTQEIQSPSFQLKQNGSPLSLPDFDLKAPAVPFYLGFSHFSLKLSLNELVARVSSCLEKIIELDYSFLENLCKVSPLLHFDDPSSLSSPLSQLLPPISLDSGISFISEDHLFVILKSQFLMKKKL